MKHVKASMQVDRSFVVGRVDPRLFGGFVEHLGRAVYEGLYEPGHPTADASGLRTDVLDLVRALDMPVTRYPGGNFVSGYNWEDGVGPRETRPVRLDGAWKTTETNQFGTNEFVDWCRKAHSAPMLAVNLGTRGMEEARQLVEYCNHPGGSYGSDLRREHGYPDPHAVKLWCLGNEIDGPWQIGKKTAREYGRLAEETAKAMRMVDNAIELVVCGSSSAGMPWFAKYEAEVLEHCFDHVDYVSTHVYYNNHKGDTPHFLSKPDEMDRQIKQLAATLDFVSAVRKSRKRIDISFDEWNVWYHSHEQNKTLPEWTSPRPLLEDVYNMEDALVVGGMLITLLNNADRVKIGCIAQTVNVIAPIMTRKGGPAWKQTIYHPFLHASRYGRGVALRPVIDSDTYENADGLATDYLHAAAVMNDDGGVALLAVNRSLDAELELSVRLGGFGGFGVKEWLTMCHADLEAVNTEAQPETVAPETRDGATVKGEEIRAALAPASWNVIRLGQP